MKKFIAFIFAALFAAGAWAYSTATVNGVTWTYTKVGSATFGTEAVHLGGGSAGGGAYYTAVPTTRSGTLVIPETINGLPVVGLNGGAFSGCDKLTQVSLPNTITNISYSAFKDCSNLCAVNLPSALQNIDSGAFSGCPKLGTGMVYRDNCLIAINGACDSDVVVKSGTRLIVSDAFFRRQEIKSVTIPDSVEGSLCSFSSCSNLISVVVGKGITRIPEGTFNRCVSIQSLTVPFVGLTRLPGLEEKNLGRWFGFSGLDEEERTSQYCDGNYHNSHMFSIPKTLTSITITDSDRIPSGAFQNCTFLKSITLPEKLNSIHDRAFDSCTALSEISIPDSVVGIRTSAFSNCCSLVTCKFPSGLTTVFDSAFEDCKALREVTFRDSIVSISAKAFKGCSSLETVEIPKSLQRIGYEAFAECTSLNSMVLPFVGQQRTGAGYGNDNFAYLFGKTAVDGCSLVGHGRYVPVSLTEVTISDQEIIYNEAFVGCSMLERINLCEGIKRIGQYCFCDCAELSDVIFPKSLETIDYYAFRNCTGLRRISIPEGSCLMSGSSGFYGCINLTDIHVTNLTEWDRKGLAWAQLMPSAYNLYIKDELVTSIVYPEGVDKILGAGNCKSLKSVTIPASAKAIDKYAFSQCKNLSKVTFSEGIEEIGYSAFSGCEGLSDVVLPKSLLKIDSYAFSGCSQFEHLAIPEKVRSVGDGAFRRCTKIKDITIPDVALKIGAEAFAGCSALQELDIPKSIESMGKSMLKGCNGLKSITLPFLGETRASPESIMYGFRWLFDAENTYFTDAGAPESLEMITLTDVTALRPYAFYYCTKVKRIHVPRNLTSIGASAYAGCTKLEAVEMPDTILELGMNAFYGCRTLTDITLPSSLSAIPAQLAMQCQNLKQIEIPSGVKSIDRYAFWESGLESVEIPSSVTSIGEYAFENCANLQSIKIPCSVTSIGQAAFSGIPTIYADVGDALRLKSLMEDAEIRVDLMTFVEPSNNITYTNTRGVENPNPISAWKSTGIVFKPLADIEGWRFRGWNITEIEPYHDGNVEVMALWDPIDYEIIYLNTLGADNTNPTSYNVETTDDIVFVSLPQVGRYKFMRWDIERIMKGSVGNVTVTAIWEEIAPKIEGDSAAEVSGDAENGFVIKPSDGTTEVVITIPEGIAAEKVTIEVSPSVKTVKANGAAIKVVKGVADITEFLDIPAAVDGVVNLSAAEVKEEIVKEALDPEQGAEIELSFEEPTLTTAETKPGLTYTLVEGTTLESMANGDSKLGDGNKWTPNISVKGGKSGFYTIKVTK